MNDLAAMACLVWAIACVALLALLLVMEFVRLPWRRRRVDPIIWPIPPHVRRAKDGARLVAIGAFGAAPDDDRSTVEALIAASNRISAGMQP